MFKKFLQKKESFNSNQSRNNTLYGRWVISERTCVRSGCGVQEQQMPRDDDYRLEMWRAGVKNFGLAVANDRKWPSSLTLQF